MDGRTEVARDVESILEVAKANSSGSGPTKPSRPKRSTRRKKLHISSS
jgi:hypothetical protein